MRKYLPVVLTVLAIAVLTHLASVYLLPRAIMARVMHRMAEQGTNEIHFAKRPDETARAVVRPSPDLLYSTCAYDLSAGPLRVRSPVPNGTYWSVSLFDDATNNFYAFNDAQARAAKQSVVDFVIVDANAKSNTEGLPAVVSPTPTGLVLFRTLINDEKTLPLIDAFRRQATCTPWRPSPADVSSKAKPSGT
jgi:uncharacterized membrane protein